MTTKLLTSLAVFILLITLTYAAIPLSGQNEIYKNTLRLHVLANSNSNFDQDLKLSVRDEIVKKTNLLFKDCKNLKEAKIKAENSLEILTQTANEKIKKSGYDYPVNITLSEEIYPERVYSDLTFPAGKYLSLRVQIGKSEGKNWWCVLFPPLCLEASSISSEEKKILENANFDEPAINILTEGENPKYQVKFKLYELIKKAFK